MGRWLALGALLALASSALSPQPARACTTAAPPDAWVGYPAHGMAGVPTDVVPYYDLLRSGLGEASLGSFQLTSESGDVIQLTAQQTFVWTFELTPERRLEPQTTYTLTLSSGALGPLAFTTGGGPVEAAPQPPRASLTHFKLDGLGSSCDLLPTGSCVGVTAGLPVAARQIDAVGNADLTPYLYAESWFTDLTGESGFDCVRLQSRAPNGTLSESVDLCGDDAPLAELDRGEPLACTASGLTQGGEAVDTSEGCNFSASKARSGSVALLALVGLSLLGRRRQLPSGDDTHR